MQHLDTPPVGIILTWGKDFIKEKGGLLAFVRFFEKTLADGESYWIQKCKNKPKHDDLLYVYIIVCGQVKYRLYYGGYETGTTAVNNGDGHSWSSRSIISWPRVVMAGPIVKAPTKIYMKGFQGFRYTQELF